MTGFARVEKQVGGDQLSWELRAVNHRYLDIQLRMPEAFRQIESALRALVAAKLGRGKFEATLRCQIGPSTSLPIELDFDRLQALRAALTEIGAVIEAAPADALAVLSWPGVMREEARDPAPLIEAATALFEAGLIAFDEARAREGAQLEAHIIQRLAALEQQVETVRARLPKARQAWLERLRAHCRQLEIELDETRLAQEIALIAQRMDVDEEMSRLRVHLGEMRQVLHRAEPVGRRLDFLLQELNREANTLSSKSQDDQMTACAVEMKVFIEQIREQVQNIE